MKKITMTEPLEILLPKLQALGGEGYTKALEILEGKSKIERKKLLKEFHSLELTVTDETAEAILCANAGQTEQ